MKRAATSISLSNKDDVRETQLYRVSLNDKSLTRITKEAGIALRQNRAGCFRVRGHLFQRRDSRAPGPLSHGWHARRSRQRRQSSRARRISTVPVEFVTVTADDGTKLNASMIKPTDFDPAKKYPVLINVYGGPHVQLVRNSWGGLRYLLDQVYAQKGYIIFTLDNRGSWGRGHAFETPIYHHMGKIELQDQLAGVKYLKSLAMWIPRASASPAAAMAAT